MRKYFTKFIILFFCVLIFLSAQNVFASEMLIFNNDHLRFGTGAETSINDSGNLKQPFYYSQNNGWRALTYYNYPLDFEIREGGVGTSWWNLNGTSLSNPTLSGFTLDSTGFTPYENGNKGYGTLIANGSVKINDKDIQINNKYELSQGKSFIKVTTKFTNLSNSTVSNLRYWVGTRDDYVGGTDGPTQEKGNLIDGAFVTITNQSTPSKALRITSGNEGVLFYTDTDKANIIIGDSYGWNFVISRDPATSLITAGGDRSYAFYVRLNDLAPNASDEIVWYYAAGPLAKLEEIVKDVASAAASVFNIGSETADFKSSSSVSGTVYYMVVPSNSLAPNAAQIESGVNYGGVTVKKSGNDSITAGIEKTFTITGLNANTGYDLYIVVKDNEGKYSSIAKNSFTTIKYSNTITFNQPDVKTYGDDQFLLGASADSNLTLRYTSSNSNVATVDAAGKVTIKAAGTTDITASEGGNESYYPAIDVTRTLTVAKRSITVQATVDKKVYDGTVNSDKIPGISEGILPNGETAVLNQKFDDKNVGTEKTLLPTCTVYKQDTDTETTSNYNITYISITGEITLAEPTINLEDKTSIYTGNFIMIDPASVTVVRGETPSGNITYVYYTDRACTTLTTPGNSGASANGQPPVYAGIYYVKATIEKTVNYASQTTSAPGTLTILSATGEALSLGSDITRTYGDESFALNATGGSGTGIVTYTSSNPQVASVSIEGHVTINSAGEAIITATKNSDGNYDKQYASVKLTVQKKPVTFIITNNNKVYNGAAQYADVTSDVSVLKAGSDYTITYYKNDSVVDSPVEPGKYGIVVLIANNNYSGSADGTMTILNAGQIDFGIGGIPQYVEYKDTFAVYPNGNINGITTFEIISGNATVNADTGFVTITGTGEVVIKATNIAENFDEQTAATLFTVHPKAIKVVAIAKERPYDAGNKNVEVELITNVEGLTAEYISAAILTADAGVDKEVTVTGISFNNTNYKPYSTTIYTTVTITPISVSNELVIEGLPSSITYGDEDFKLMGIAQGTGKVTWRSSDRTVVKVNSSTGVVTITGAGSAVITATKESDGNYQAVSGNITIEVVKKNVTYSIINNTKVYNGSAQYAVITPSEISLVKDLDYKVIYSKDGTEVEEPVEADVYDINIETLNDNYEGNSTGAILTILEANQTSPLVIGGLSNYIEYEDTFSLYANGGNGEGNVNWAIESGSEYADVTSGSGIVSIIGVGTVTVSATKEGDGNYKDQTASVTFTTNKKQINIVISNTLKTYNGYGQKVNISATSTSYNSFEDIAGISYVNQEDGTETEFRNVGTYNVSVNVNDDYSEHYELTGSLSAVASIKKANIIITADSKEKVYGYTNPEFTLSYNLLGEDEKKSFIEPTITCTANEASNVGEYEIVLSNKKENTNTNYDLILRNGKLNIKPALLTVTADDKSVYYGKSAPTYTYSISGLKGNDTISDLAGKPVFSCEYIRGSEVGEYDINISGFASNNYDFDYIIGRLTVLPQISGGGSGSSSGSSVTVSPVEPIEEQYKNPFDDINEGDWFYEGVVYVNKAELMSGTGPTTFEPYMDTTRSMIVTILYRMEKEPDVFKTTNFNDVIKGTWYNKAVAWGEENGVIKGYDLKTFGPNDKITREQLAAILYRYASNKGYIGNNFITDLSLYEDHEKISPWAVDSMQWAVSQGIITGTSTTAIDPQGYATRAQTAVCLIRFIKNIIQ